MIQRFVKTSAFLALLPLGIAIALSAPIEPKSAKLNGQPLEKTSVQVDGHGANAWIFDVRNGPLELNFGAPIHVRPDGFLYLKIDCLDDGYGRLDVQLQPKEGPPVKPDRGLKLSRTNSGGILPSLIRFAGIKAGEDDSMNLKISIERKPSGILAIEGVSLQEAPFDDPDFQYVISNPWDGPYHNSGSKAPDNRTLKGKVMTGYQGWFRTPNDPQGGGWIHWGDISRGLFTVDMWPDVSQYPPSCLEKADDVKLKSGKQAYLFSSAWPGVVNTHFRWMREYGIDGAFLQRFVSDGFNSISGGPEWVLANVRSAAHREGRIWAIEYDVSGYPDAKLLETLKTDWKWFVDRFRVRDDENYAREGDKPVVFIWGMPFPDRNISPATADAVVDFFKNDPQYGGNYVIGGIPGNWRKMDRPWQEHIEKYDCVLPWMSQSFAEDIVDLKRLDLSYYAHVSPGFSWANLKHLPGDDLTVQFTPRNHGLFYQNQFARAVDAGSDRIFAGMFDEYDEGTAIMPMSDDSPPTPVASGVASTFYNGPNAAEQGEFLRIPSVDLNLGTTAPSRTTHVDRFFVRMCGRITFSKEGRYTFSVEGAPGDDFELFMNGTKIAEATNLNGSPVSSPQIEVRSGTILPYRLEYRHRAGKGKLRLLWESSSISRQPVPSTALQDAWGRFLTNEGNPPDHWLKLTSQGGKQMTDKLMGNSSPP